MSEAWTWTCADASGKPVDVSDLEIPFPTQADAESWLGESWPDLADAGAESVTLLRDGMTVYGPMSLREV